MTDKNVRKHRTAVVLYGFLRTWELTAPSLVKHVLEPNAADLFIYAPTVSGNQIKYHKSSNRDAVCGETIAEERLKQLYGPYLKKYCLCEYQEKNILGDIDLSHVAVIADINPIRQVSLFYHIRKSLLLLEEYEREHNFRYDNIILTRPDIAFYSPITMENLDLDVINMPKGEGIERHTGTRRYGLATVFYYKNVEEAVCIPGGTYVFSDLVMVSKRDHIIKLKEIYNNFQDLMNKQVPCNAETICFYWLNTKHSIRVVPSLNVVCEIFRPYFKEIENVNDLSGWEEDKTLSPFQIKISNHLTFYKLFFYCRYAFHRKKRREMKKLIKVLKLRKNRKF